MKDSRVEALAQILVRYSTKVKPGDVCVIQGTTTGEPLIQAVYEEILRAGGLPVMQLTTEAAAAAFFELANDDQLDWVQPPAEWTAENADVRIVVSGAGAAGTAIVTLLLAAGAHDVVVVDREGALAAGDESLSRAHVELAAATNPRRATGSLRDVLVDADVFVGVSAPGILDAEWIPTMAPKPVVFALANPDPEVDPAEADKYAAVVASGRSDYPNQINNVLAFPGVFRGLLDAGASEVTIDMLLRAAQAIADTVKPDELHPAFIIPSVFHPDVTKRVASAISGREA